MSTVGTLLRLFPEKGVFHVTLTHTIFEAVGEMKRQNISSLLITNDEDVFVGILSERDIAWKVVLDKKDPNTTKVGEVMTPRKEIVSVTTHTTLTECLELMRDHNIRHLPVLGGDGEPVGIISLKDITRHLEILADDLQRFITGHR